MSKAFRIIDDAKEYAIKILEYYSPENIKLTKGKNKDCTEPIMIPNPAALDIINWESFYGTIRSEADRNKIFDNPIENDLHHNYTSAFGTKEAIELYRKTGEITRDLSKGIGISFPLKISDAIKHREMFVGDGYTDYDYWVYRWRLKNGLRRHIPAEIEEDVFIVECDYGSRMTKESLTIFVNKNEINEYQKAIEIVKSKLYNNKINKISTLFNISN